MSTDLATTSPAEQVETIMGLMTSRRIRHLPVLREAGWWDSCPSAT